MLQDFAVGLWFRRLQKRVRKIRFFSYCIQDSPISSFHLQKSRLYALIFWFYPLLCKGHLSIFDLCWGDFTTPPSYYIGRLFQIFNHPPGSVEGKKLSPPRIGIVAISPPPGAWYDRMRLLYRAAQVSGIRHLTSIAFSAFCCFLLHNRINNV